MAKMKESGVKWIGEIPNTWNIKKVKYLATQPESIFKDGDWIESDVIIDEGIRYLTTGNVGAGYFKEQGSGYISGETFKKLKCLKVLPEDLMISRLNEPIGRACMVPDTEDMYVVAVDNVILRPDEIYDKKFIMYCMNTTGYAEAGKDAARGSTMQRVSRSLLGNFYIPIAHLKEQQLIASFLDDKVGRIDEILNDLNSQIKILDKYKKSIITETVTRGLDPNVELKDSGVDWIGKIPKNCKILKLKNMVEIKDGTHDTPDYIEAGEDTVPLITGRFLDYNKHKILYDEANHISYYDYKKINIRSNVEYNDIIMPMIGTIGNPVIVKEQRPFSIKNVALFKTSHDEILAKYLYYQLNSNIIDEQFNILIRGGVQSFVSLNIIENLLAINVEKKNQQEIVRYLDNKCRQIDTIILDKQMQIEKMQKYKKSLIYEYVTGKKRVKGAEELYG